MNIPPSIKPFIHPPLSMTHNNSWGFILKTVPGSLRAKCKWQRAAGLCECVLHRSVHEQPANKHQWPSVHTSATEQGWRTITPEPGAPRSGHTGWCLCGELTFCVSTSSTTCRCSVCVSVHTLDGVCRGTHRSAHLSLERWHGGFSSGLSHAVTSWWQVLAS